MSEHEKQELLLDLAQMGLDIAGIFDPSGVVDVANALGYLLRGKLGDAFLTGLGVAPLVGDLVKAGKLGKFVQTLARAVDLAKTDAQFAKAAEMAFGKMRDVLNNTSRYAHSEGKWFVLADSNVWELGNYL